MLWLSSNKYEYVGLKMGLHAFRRVSSDPSSLGRKGDRDEPLEYILTSDAMYKDELRRKTTRYTRDTIDLREIG